jgi:hypothetical protein
MNKEGHRMTKTSKRFGLAIASSVITAAAAFAQPVTAVNSTLNLTARAVALLPGGPQSFDSVIHRQGAMLNPPLASVSATDFATSDDFGDVSLTTSGAATAVWTGATSGRVEFTPVGGTVSNGTSASPQLQYEFVPKEQAASIST